MRKAKVNLGENQLQCSAGNFKLMYRLVTGNKTVTFPLGMVDVFTVLSAV